MVVASLLSMNASRFVCCSLLGIALLSLGLTRVVRAQDDSGWEAVDEFPPTSAPTKTAPEKTPPPPPDKSPPPPPEVSSAPAPAPTEAIEGQWVYTSQYGWVWIPYADEYVHVVPDGTLALTYLYYPAFGWTWVYSPWVLGWGPRPHWGALGVVRFGWHTRPWFRIGPTWRGAYWAGRWKGRWLWSIPRGDRHKHSKWKVHRRRPRHAPRRHRR